MAACPFFTHLVARITVLEQKFITQQLADELANPLSFQPDTDFLAAYRLLVHAEIEDFLERKARAQLDANEKQITNQKPIIPALWAYQLANHFAITIPHDCPFDDGRFRTAIDTVIKRAREALSDNNGIKTSIYVTVCLICGFSIEKIDSTLGAALSIFGEARGDVAHKSTNRVTSIRAPSAEKKDVDDIMKALSLFFFPPSPQTSTPTSSPTPTGPSVATPYPVTPPMPMVATLTSTGAPPAAVVTATVPKSSI